MEPSGSATYATLEECQKACDPPPPGAGACCIDGVCSLKTEAECQAAGGAFRGAGVACADDTCRGACCGTDPDGYGCSQLTKPDCLAAGGWWFQGEGVPCTATPCPGPAPSIALTISGVKNRHTGQPFPAFNKTVVVPLLCPAAGSAVCPTADGGGSEVVQKVEWAYTSSPETSALAYVAFTVRPNCTIYNANLALRSGPNLSINFLYAWYAVWLLGYSEDPDTGMANTPLPPCPTAGAGGGGAHDYYGPGPNNAQELHDWDLTDAQFTFQYV